MRIVLLGDVGAAAGYHAGDEAMAEAVVDEIGARTDVSVIALSRNLVDTRERYGWETVHRIGFDSDLWTDTERDARLDAVLAAAGGDTNALAWGDPAWDVIHAVAEADAVVISGGGNLNSSWPEHIYERVAVAQLAGMFNKRHVVTGQTLGPHLTARNGEHVGKLLTSAALVGTRDAASYDVAQRLGVLPDRLVRVVDDAAYLRTIDPALQLPDGPYIAATFAPHSGLLDGDDFVSSIAALFDHVTSSTGMRVLLIPHQTTVHDGLEIGDAAMHGRIAAAANTSMIELLLPVSARQAAAITGSAALVISTRYHPVVFALSASVPALGIAVDAYTSTKIHGAMANYGVGDFAISVASLVDGGADAALDDILGRTSDLTAHLDVVNALRRKEAVGWWDAVTAALTGTDDVAPAVGIEPVATFDGGSWSNASRALRDWSYSVSTRYGADRLHNEESAAESLPLKHRIIELERGASELAADLSLAADEIESLRASTRAAHRLVSDPLRPLATWLVDLPTIEALRAELDGLYRSRTFRYLRVPRQIYRRLRARRLRAHPPGGSGG